MSRAGGNDEPSATPQRAREAAHPQESPKGSGPSVIDGGSPIAAHRAAPREGSLPNGRDAPWRLGARQGIEPGPEGTRPSNRFSKNALIAGRIAAHGINGDKFQR